MSVQLQSRHSDMFIGGLNYRPGRFQELAASFTHFTDKNTIFNFNQSEPINPYLLIFYPLSLVSWIVLVFVLQFLSVMLYISTQKSYIDTSFEIYRISFDFSCSKSPSTASYRFIVFLIIILNMEINNLYVSQFYELLQTDRMKPQPQSIKDLCTEKYVLVVKPYHRTFLKNIPEIKSGLLKVQETDQEIFSQSILEYIVGRPSMLGVDGFEDFNYLYPSLPENVKNSITFLPIVLMHAQITFYFPMKSVLVNEINRVIMELQTGGIIDYIMNSVVKQKLEENREKSTRHITLTELEGLFSICCGLGLMSTLVFIGELQWERFRNKLFSMVSHY